MSTYTLVLRTFFCTYTLRLTDRYIHSGIEDFFLYLYSNWSVYLHTGIQDIFSILRHWYRGHFFYTYTLVLRTFFLYLNTGIEGIFSLLTHWYWGHFFYTYILVLRTFFCTYSDWLVLTHWYWGHFWYSLWLIGTYTLVLRTFLVLTLMGTYTLVLRTFFGTHSDWCLYLIHMDLFGRRLVCYLLY